MLLLCAAVQSTPAALPVAGRDWFEAPPTVFTPRLGAASAVFNNKIWVIGGADGVTHNDVWCSDDGAAWSRVCAAAPFPSRTEHACVAYGGKLWVIGGKSDEMHDSFHIKYLNDVWSSPDGVNWTQATASAPFPARFAHAAAVFNGAMWVIGGRLDTKVSPYMTLYNDVWSSTDGTRWTKAPVPPFKGRYGLSALTFNNRLWVIGGLAQNVDGAGEVWSSGDGNAWTTATATAAFGDRRGHASVVHDGAMWVIGGYETSTQGVQNDVWRSSDGVTWSLAAVKADFSPREAFNAVAFGGEIWVTGGGNGVWHSAAGLKWSRALAASPAPGLANQVSVVHGGRLWILGGEDATLVMNSDDGANWRAVSGNLNLFGHAGYAGLEFNNEIWIVGGKNAMVYHSRDGAAWASQRVNESLGGRTGSAAVTFGGRIWVLGGGDPTSSWADQTIKNDVWSSPDGLNWTRVTAVAAFSARTKHLALVHAGRIWIIGGLDKAGCRNDVWSSADGATWRQETAAAGFAPRSRHAGAVYDGRMWVFGGDGGAGSTYGDVNQYQDVWSSTDGAHWTQESAAAFPMRYGHNGVVFDGKLWAVGGLGRRDSRFTYGSQPHLHLSTTSLEFGERFIGAGPGPAASVMLRNDGLSTLTFSEITLSGANDGQVRFVAPPSTAPLAPLTTRTVSVVVEPTVLGPQTAALTFRTNDPESPASVVSVEWYGVSAGLNVSPMQLDFGPAFTRPGSRAVRRIVLTNKSPDTTITLGPINWTGPTPDFHFAAAAPDLSPIPPNASRALDLWFDPSAVGPRSAVMEITADSPAGPSPRVTLTGTGVAPVAGRDWFEAIPAVFSPRAGLGALNHNGQLWVIGGNDGQPRSDVWAGDGITWTRASGAAFTARAGFAATTFKGRMWVHGGCRPTHAGSYGPSLQYYSEVWSSADGVEWTQAGMTAPFARAGHTMTDFSGKLWVIGGELSLDYSSYAFDRFYNDVWASDDGAHWFPATQKAPFSGRRGHATVVFNNRLWVIGGRGAAAQGSSSRGVVFNDVWSSADGVSWTSATLSAAFPPRYGHACAAFAGKLWLIGGCDGSDVTNNEIWNSSDGANWRRVTPDRAFTPRAGCACVVRGTELWVIGGADDGAWHSADGVHWAESAAPHPGARTGQVNLSFGGRLWIIGGRGWDGQLRNDVWSSPNGTSWTRATAHAAFAPIVGGVGLSFQNKMWLAGGNGAVWRSSDGVNWTTATKGASFPNPSAGLVHNNRMWLFSGAAAWSSPDGVAWAKAPAGAYGSRSGQAVADFRQRMWMLGGRTYVNDGRVGAYYLMLNDAWVSTEGAAWTRATSNAGFSGRCDARAESFDGRMWIVGGQVPGFFSTPSYFGDAWSSTDGAAWSCASALAPFAPRYGHGLTVLGQRMYVVGGVNADGALSDAWFTYGDGQGGAVNAVGAWRNYE